SHKGRGESESRIDKRKYTGNFPSPLVGEGKQSRSRERSSVGEGSRHDDHFSLRLAVHEEADGFAGAGERNARGHMRLQSAVGDPARDLVKIGEAFLRIARDGGAPENADDAASLEQGEVEG